MPNMFALILDITHDGIYQLIADRIVPAEDLLVVCDDVRVRDPQYDGNARDLAAAETGLCCWAGNFHPDLVRNQI